MKKILFAISLLFLVSCVPQQAVRDYQDGITPTNASLNTVEYIIIDGMPCLHYKLIASQETSMTCDWSQWNGYVIDGTIVIPSEVPMRTSTYEP